MRKQHTLLSPPLTKIALISTLFIAQGVMAHGYVSSPESRSYKCKLGQNVNCGPVQWEPQSVEGPDRYPESGPADGKIASAGLSQFSQLDEQTATRWHKSTIKPGPNKFSWHFTANHATRDWRYFITKNDWNPNQALTRSSFEATPFCSIDGNQSRPPVDVTHDCNVPERNGYHVVLAVWDVGDTVNSFYQAIDVNISGKGSPDPDVPDTQWQDIGDINPTMNLQSGDQVKARFFNKEGEQINLTTSITINSAKEGQKNNWPHLLATEINKQHKSLAAGQLGKDGKIVPTMGQNNIYTLQTSDIRRAEVQIVKDQKPDPNVNVGGLKDNYVIQNNEANVDFTLTSAEKLTVDYLVFDKNNAQVAFGSTAVNNSTESVVINIKNARPGDYTLVIKTKTFSLVQQTYQFKLVNDSTDPGDDGQNGDYDYSFPEGVSNYKAGTTVLQPKNGKVYQCKPFPYSGYCKQWTSTSNNFEPGVGSHWKMAWDEQ
ncbi:N-acetylglucosamine-binding protein GbpA [Zooshikella sp. RANM57]|uniref:N-acetylglucosamine-binding protein GbpA n=1 Tax=Zooshikella sp. RANM57 TaxID=3425863 RepID=UPI003D6E4EC8